MKSSNEYSMDMTPEQIMIKLHIHLAYWKRQLRLDGIDISLRWLGAEEDRVSAVGKAFSYLQSHRAIIAICHPDYIEPVVRRMLTGDYETILVHELIHVREAEWREDKEVTDIFDNNSMIESAHETAVDVIAEALVRARRGITRS